VSIFLTLLTIENAQKNNQVNLETPKLNLTNIIICTNIS